MIATSSGVVTSPHSRHIATSIILFHLKQIVFGWDDDGLSPQRFAQFANPSGQAFIFPDELDVEVKAIDDRSRC